jgi:hypothetical protein
VLSNSELSKHLERKRKKKKKKKFLGSGTVKFQPWYFWCYSLSIPSWCWYLSSISVVSPGGWVRRQLCEPLSALFQAGAHLLPNVSHLLLQALFTDSSHGKHLIAFSSLLWWRGLPASYYCRLCLLKVHLESSSLILPPSPVHSEHLSPSTVCPFQFLAYDSVVFWFYFCLVGVSPSGAMLVYPKNGCRSTLCRLFA